MAKLNVFGDALVLTSALKLEDIKKLETYKPESLKLIDDETKEDVFKISHSSASFNKFGASFASSNTEGKATMTLPIPAGMTAEEKLEYVKHVYGYAILNLNLLEGFLEEELKDLEVEFKTMEESISVLD